MLIRLGVDVVDLDRFRFVISRTPKIVERLFTVGERADAFAARDPMERLAARFAAKEATLKALGVGLGAVSWQDVEIASLATGEPTLALQGRAAQRAIALGLDRWSISLTHSRLVAVASVAGYGTRDA